MELDGVCSDAIQERDNFEPIGQGEEWQEAMDPNSGMTYYYNSETGDVQWEKPEELLPPVTEDSIIITTNNDAVKGELIKDDFDKVNEKDKANKDQIFMNEHESFIEGNNVPNVKLNSLAITKEKAKDSVASPNVFNEETSSTWQKISDPVTCNVNSDNVYSGGTQCETPNECFLSSLEDPVTAEVNDERIDDTQHVSFLLNFSCFH